MLQNPLQLTPAVIVSSPDERGEQACALWSGFSKSSDTPRILESKVQVWVDFMPCCQKVFVPIKFCQ